MGQRVGTSESSLVPAGERAMCLVARRTERGEVGLFAEHLSRGGRGRGGSKNLPGLRRICIVRLVDGTTVSGLKVPPAAGERTFGRRLNGPLLVEGSTLVVLLFCIRVMMPRASQGQTASLVGFLLHCERRRTT